MHSSFEVEYFFALKKWGHQIRFWDISFVDMVFFERIWQANQRSAHRRGLVPQEWLNEYHHRLILIYLNIQLIRIHCLISIRLWGATTEFVGLNPQSLMLRSQLRSIRLIVYWQNATNKFKCQKWLMQPSSAIPWGNPGQIQLSMGT